MKLKDLQQIIESMAATRIGTTRVPHLESQVPRLQQMTDPYGIKIFAGDWKVLREVCQTIDGESDSDHSWRMVGNVREYCGKSFPEQAKHVQTAASTNIERSTVFYFDRKKKEVATGVLIEVGNRLFVATTEHSVPFDAQSRLIFVPHVLVGTDRTTVPILGAACDKNPHNDLAVIELHISAPDILLKEPITMSRIDVSGTGRPHHPVIFGGYPFALGKFFEIFPLFANPNHAMPTGAAKFRMMSYIDHFIPEVDWPLLEIPNGSPAPDPMRDVFLPWPEGDGEVTSSDPSLKNALCDPSGMSGCGYWHVPNPTIQGIWLPDRFHLTAIQHGWWEPGQYVRGTQIVHWIQLLWTCIPELRRTIGAAFPSITFAAVDFTRMDH
jgi:hypothetical protein